MLPAAAAPRVGGVVEVRTGTPPMVRIRAGAFPMGFGAQALGLEGDERAAAVRQLTERAVRLCRDIVGLSLMSRCGGDGLRSATPARMVLLPEYFIDRLEVTTAQYRECVAAGACLLGPLAVGDARYAKDAWPVVGVTWFEASAYCGWRGKRLPTEAEWERAARGMSGRWFPWGDYWRHRVANIGKMDTLALRWLSAVRSGVTHEPDVTVVGDPEDGFALLAPPGALPWGQTPEGVRNLAGNVSEWVADYYSRDGYGDLPSANPSRQDPVSGNIRVVRGGAWLGLRHTATVFTRLAAPPESRRIDIGFRCARSALPL